MFGVPDALRRLGIALILVAGFVAVGTTPVAADHNNNHCENHHEEDGDIENTVEKVPVFGTIFRLDDEADDALDTLSQNQCAGTGSVSDPYGVPEYGRDRGDSMYTPE